MDLKIKTEEQEFHGRSCGIIKQDNYFLIMRVDKTSYYHIPGGHIKINEDSRMSAIREIKEEVGCDVKDAKLFAIQENFWKRKGKNCHGIEFYYIVEPKQKLLIKDYEKIEDDNGDKKLLEFKWVSAKELNDIDLRPHNIKKILMDGKYDDGLMHLIERDV